MGYSGDAYITHHDGPLLTGVPFNDAYRYMDWLLTVPLLLIEILLVMKLDEKDFNSRAWTLGVGSALMIVSGYYGELVVTGDLTPRWVCWFLSMAFFLYIVYELLGTCCGYQERRKPNHCEQDRHSTGHDMHQLVHLPNCLLVSNVPDQSSRGSRWYSIGLLCV